MAHSAYVWGVRVYLQNVIPQDTSVGLYTSTTSELRWIEAPVTLSDTPTTWSSAMLIGDLEGLEQSADFSRGGAPAQMIGTTVRASNTGQLSVILATYGEQLHGLKCEVYEFTLNAAGDTESARDVIFTGTIGDVKWSETELSFSVEDCSGKRRAQLLTVIDNDASGSYPDAAESDNGVAIPATFGELTKAKMVRTAKAETVLESDDLYEATGATAGSPAGLKRFPIVSTAASATLTYTVKVALTKTGVWFTSSITTLVGAYMRVVGGTGNGQIRKIAAAAFDTSTTISVTLDSYYADTLAGNSTATATDNSWVEFDTVAREYALDVWPCHAFMDDATPAAETTSPLDLFSYDAPKTVDVSGDEQTGVSVREKQVGYYPLPQYAYTEQAGTNHNGVTIDAKLFDGDFDKMEAAKIVQPAGADISLPTDATLTNWGAASAVAVASCPGLYTTLSSPPTASATTSPAANWPSALDRDATTYERAAYSISDLGLFIHAVVIKPPAPPTDFEFDNVYLIIKHALTKTGTWETPIYSVKVRKFFGSSDVKYTKQFDDIGGGGSLAAPNAINIITLPDFFLSPPGGGGDLCYFVDEFVNSTVGGTAHQYGAINLPITAEEYRAGALYEVAVLFQFEIYAVPRCPPRPFILSMDYYEFAFAFTKSVSIKESVFTGIRGRIYNDTWGGRQTAANLMQVPVSILEHTLRLQNWDEEGTPTQHGKAYASTAKIKTSGDGSFDDTAILGPYGGTDVSLWLPNDTVMARQILEVDDGYTDAITRSLCRAMHGCVYRDEDGYECVRFIQTEEAAATAVTLATVMGRIQIEEPRPRDVFVEPFVNYAYNYGSGKFDGTMRILNVNNPGGTGWQASYTPGLNTKNNLETGRYDGDVLWELCNSLWDKFKRVEIPPSELTDMPWFADYTSALWYLHRWVKWMGKRRASFSVPYSVGKAWFVSERISINFPHQTDGKTVNCIVERIRKVKNGTPSRCDVTVVMVDEITSAELYQDTDAGSVPNWQDIDVGGTATYQNID